MKHVMAAALLFSMGAAAAAQELPEILIRPQGDAGLGGDFVGPFGRDLPGVSMFSGRAAPVAPSFADGEVPLPSRQQIANEYTFQDPLPILDGWHGTLSRGFPF